MVMVMCVCVCVLCVCVCVCVCVCGGEGSDLAIVIMHAVILHWIAHKSTEYRGR